MDPPAARSTRIRDVAVLLPCVGLVLLMPPFIGLFTGSAIPLGVPLLVWYVFGVWAVLVGAACVLSRRLPPADS